VTHCQQPFSIVIDDILKQLELRGNISTRLKQCSAYAELPEEDENHKMDRTSQRSPQMERNC
jgi:hypothetical protein